MSKIFSVISAVLMLTLSYSFIGTVQAQDDLNLDSKELVAVGDFIELSVWSLLDEKDGMQLHGYMRMELTGTETITVEGKHYDCMVLSMIGTGDISSNVDVTGTWETSANIYFEAETGNDVQERSISDYTIVRDGNKVVMQSESKTIPISENTTWEGEELPELGDTWTVTTVANETWVNTYITIEETETEVGTENVTTIKHHEYLKNVTIETKLGTSECMVIRSYDDDVLYFEDDYSLDYTEKYDNIPILFEDYEDGRLTMKMETIAYDLDGMKGGKEVLGPIGAEKEDDEDEGLFGMGKIAGVDVFIIISAAIIVTVTIIIVVILKKRQNPEQWK